MYAITYLMATDHLPVQTAYQYRLLPILDPSKSSKVGRFSTVKAMIKASMIAIRKGYHELSSLLCHLEDS